MQIPKLGHSPPPVFLDHRGIIWCKARRELCARWKSFRASGSTVSTHLRPLQSALTKNAPVTRLGFALSESLDLKSFRIRTYKNVGGWGHPYRLSDSQRGSGMTPRHRCGRAQNLFYSIVSILFVLVFFASAPAEARTREPYNIYAERRAKLRALVDGPVVLFGYTGREDASPSYVFHQEENFYYLTGHNQPGAALVLVPEQNSEKGADKGGDNGSAQTAGKVNGKNNGKSNGKSWDGSREILFLPPHDTVRERWEGPRTGPTDPGVLEKTGFASVESFADLRGTLEKLAKIFPNVYTL